MEKVRTINRDELYELIELYNHLHSKDLPLPNKKELNIIWDEIISNPHFQYFVLEKEGRFISSCTLSVIPNLTRGA